jgi:hypothetical protein
MVFLVELSFRYVGLGGFMILTTVSRKSTRCALSVSPLIWGMLDLANGVWVGYTRVGCLRSGGLRETGALGDIYLMNIYECLLS